MEQKFEVAANSVRLLANEERPRNTRVLWFRRLRLNCLGFGTTVQKLSTVQEIVLRISEFDARAEIV